MVANATTTNGLAAHYTCAGGPGLGHADARPTPPPHEATSTVYYAAGQQACGRAIATELGLKPAAVQPLTAAVPVTGTSGNDVVVVIGADLAAGGRNLTTPGCGSHLPDSFLLARSETPARSALCLDFDGTLSPIVDDPVGGAVRCPGCPSCWPGWPGRSAWWP